MRLASPLAEPLAAAALLQDPTTAAEAAQAAAEQARTAAEAARAAGEAVRAEVREQAAEAARLAGQAAPAAAPRNIGDVRGLRARRDILRDQLERASNRREGVLDELRQASDAARPGLEQRLKLLDERVLQLEREQAATEQSLAGADPSLLAQERTEYVAELEAGSRGKIDEDEAVGMMFGGFGAGLVLALTAARVRGWWRRRRARRSGLPTSTDAMPTVVARDPRIDQLTQAVDSIALEVERISEGQRFVTQLLANPGQRPEPQPAARGEPRDAHPSAATREAATRETAATPR